MLDILILVALEAVPVFLIWAAIHEGSHLFMIDRLEGLVDWEMTLIPEMTDKGWRWASIRWVSTKSSSAAGRGWISIAPRLPDLVACAAFPFTALIEHDLFKAAMVVLVGGGLVDLANGSIGWNKHSDLKKTARAWDISPWILRVAGFVALASSLAAWWRLT